MILRRARFGDLVRRQLDLFEQDHADVVAEAADRLRAYDAGGRGEAEDLYGDYLLVVEAGTEALEEIRDHYARTLAGQDADRYAVEFGRAAARRFPRFPLGPRS